MKIKARVKRMGVCFAKCYKIVFGINPIYVSIILLFTILAGFLPSISTMLMQSIINSISTNIILKQVIILCLIYIILDILSNIIIKVASHLSFIINKKASIAVSIQILDKIKELELKDFENTETYNLIQRAQNESNGKIYSYFTSYLVMFQSLITIFSSFLIIRNWKNIFIVILISITIMRMIFLIFIGEKKYLILRNRTTKERKKWYYQFLLSNDVAFKEIKIYNLYAYFIDKFRMLANEFLKQDTDINKKQILTDFFFVLLDCLLSGWIFILLVIESKNGIILVGDMIAYMRSISNIKNNVESFCLQLVNIWENTLYISQIFELLDIKTKKVGGENTKKIDKIESIRLINVSYKYKEKYVLQNINMQIDVSEAIVLVGQNGAGKSTLIKLICGYYDNYEGEILINGIELRTLDIREYRKKVGILFQDFFMYELSLRENVALSNLNYINDDERITKKLNEVGFTKYEFIDMQLGNWFENGRQLSKGEWLKVALARAFIREADAYIVDEPNSALDPISEAEMMQHFKNMIKGKIGIIVTHKLTNVSMINGKIIVMSNGKIVGEGTHDFLYRNCSLYFDLVSMSEKNN